MRIVEAPNPPLNLVLGRGELDRVREKLARLMADLDAWEALTVSADYPEPAANASPAS